MKLILLALACGAAAFSDFKVSLYESDSLRADRGAATVSAGLPFNKGELLSLSQIAILDKMGQALPAQFSPLVRFEDGSFQWVLADFQANLAKKDTARFTVKNQAGNPAPAVALGVDSASGSAYYVNTGVIRFRVRKSNFNLIDSLWQGNKLLIAGAGGGLKINDGSDRFGSAVDRIGFEYLGPLRATLLVEGTFFTAAAGGLTYKVRIHAHAGSGELKIETSVRNASNKTAGANASLSNGELLLPLGPGFAAVRKPAQDTLVENWQTAYCWYEDATHGLLTAARFGGGFSADLGYNKLTLANNVLSVNIVRFATQLPDLATVDKTVFLKFYAGAATAASAAAQVSFWRHAPLAVADVSRLSETRGLASGRFGDFRDEQAVLALHQVDVTRPSMMNTGWGLYNANLPPDPPNGTNSPEDWLLWDCPVVKHTYSPGGNPYVAAVHADMETDPLEGNLLTWIRTLNSNFYKRTWAWAGYFKTFYPLRTDGFEYTGQYSINGTLSGASARGPKSFGLSGVLTDGRCDEIPQSGSYACHVFGWGLGDYYVLTGDAEARDALVDLAEIGWVNDNRSGRVGGGGTRAIARRWRLVARAYEITRDPQWLTRLKYYETAVFTLPFEPRGFFWNGGAAPGDDFTAQRLFADSYTKPYLVNDYATISHAGLGWISNTLFTRFQQGSSQALWRPSGLATWETSFLEDAAFRSHQITGNEAVRDLVLGLSQFAYHFAYNPVCQRNHYEVMLDFPLPDSLRSGTFVSTDLRVHQFLCDSLRFMSNASTCDSVVNVCNVKAHHSGYDDFLWVNGMTDAYEFTGDRKFLDRAWRDWSNGSRTPWSFTKYVCDTGLVGGYSNCPEYTWNLASPVVRLFYTDLHRKSDNVPPSPAADLTVTKTGQSGEWRLLWTTPADVGAGGEAQIKFDTVPIVEYENFKYADHYKFSYDRTSGENLVGSSFPFKANAWWLTKNAGGEPAPQPGAYQGFNLTVNAPVVYFAVKFRDAAENLSPLSNVARGDPATAVEREAGKVVGAVTLSAIPNPLSSAGRIHFNVPVLDSRNLPVALRVFDTRGREVRRLHEGALPGGAHQVRWTPGKLPAGVYLLQLNVGAKQRHLKLAVVK